MLLVVHAPSIPGPRPSQLRTLINAHHDIFLCFVQWVVLPPVHALRVDRIVEGVVS